ncbi:MAG: tRNA lysidine(34) synthetase TilS, partial [Endomicrobiales bacterium]|nr:tRNA lysidine(34) synthetase TilS [Endomicrobiales bacterium]
LPHFLVELLHYSKVFNMDIFDKFKKTVIKNNLVKSQDRILLAVSGGPDSVCLTHLFWRMGKTVDVEIEIMYVDHGLRKQAKREKKFIQDLGKRFKIPAHIEKIPVREYSDLKKISLETAGRALRYSALISLAKKLKCSKIATGHNANDNAETMLMWLIRGTGTEGLAGIPVYRLSEKNARDKIKIIRPVLSLTRNEIVRYLHAQKLSYCVDHTNYSMDYTRNKIRHKIIPIFNKLNPCFVEHLYNLSSIVNRENEFLGSLTAKAIRRAVSINRTQISLDLKRFFEYNKTIQLRLIKAILPEKKSSVQVERIKDWICLSNQSKLRFSSSWVIVKKGRRVIFKKSPH